METGPEKQNQCDGISMTECLLNDLSVLSLSNDRDNLEKVEADETSHPLILRPPVARKKLLIMDLNGLLADIVSNPPKGCKPDIKIMRRAGENCCLNICQLI